METPERPLILVAEDGVPEVEALARALPAGVIRIDCAGPLPDRWPAGITGPATLLLHRRYLTDADAERLRKARRTIRLARVILIVGPHARYDQVQRWSMLVDCVIPEAVAAEVLPRHLDRFRAARHAIRSGAVAIVSTDFELRAMWVEVCRQAGFEAVPARDWTHAPAGVPAVWDVPLLEPSWPNQLAAAATSRRVIALLGLADRPLVEQARNHGAAACLDLPCDPADLLAVLERVVGAPEPLRLDAAHAGSPPPRRLGGIVGSGLKPRSCLDGGSLLPGDAGAGPHR